MTDEARHRDRMARKKATRERLMARKTETRGLVIVHTGPGKGKSTAAWGMSEDNRSNISGSSLLIRSSSPRRNRNSSSSRFC